MKETYTVTAENLEIDGEVQPTVSESFTMPEINTIYKPTLTFDGDVTEIKADGASKVLVTFKLDEEIANAEDVVVAFTSTFGKFAQQRVTVQNGVATVMFNSEFFTELKVSEIRAQVVEAADTNLIGLKADSQISLNPNPNGGGNESVGASLTDAESNQADRITLYFNRDVDVADYVKANTDAEVDATKAVININGSSSNVAGILPVAGNPKAIQVLVNTPLADNKSVKVEFEDKTGTVSVKRDVSFILTDARTPELLSVVADGLNALVVTFSEPIYETGVDATDAINLAKKLSINGKLLNDPSLAATAEIGKFDNEDGTDNRHVVRIELGLDASNKQIYFTAGDYSLQATQIGDWAAKTDATNIIANQTLDFKINADDSIPTATVEVQSPEQFILSFDRKLNAITEADLAAALEFQIKGTDGKYTQDTRLTFTDTSGAGATFLVTAIPNTNKFKIELQDDWTNIYNTSSTTKNYYNDSFRLVLAEDAVTAVTNGNANVETTLGLGGALLTPDATSPVITDVTSKNGIYTVDFSEPIKVNFDGVLQNAEPATRGQGQQNLQDVRVEFVKADNSKTVAADFGSLIKTEDKAITVTPKSPLDAGDWKVVVRSISDDYGNTAESREFKFTVEGGAEAVADQFRVTWMKADTVAGQEQIQVKFNKAGSLTGDFKNILKASNYTFNGSDLPKTAQIIADIAGYDNYDNVTDSITILLPAGTLQPSNVLNISGLLESTEAGDKLSNPGEYVLDNAQAVAIVTSQDNLAKALANPLVTDIKIVTDFGTPAEPIKITRPVNVELSTDIADLVFATEQAGTIKLDGAKTVTNLTIDTPNAEFVLGTDVIATNVVLEDTYSSTFTNEGTITKLTVTDTNGASVENQDVDGIDELIIDTTGAVTLDGTFANVRIIKAAKVTLADGAAVTFTEVAAGAEVKDSEGNDVSTEPTVDSNLEGAVFTAKVAGNEKEEAVAAKATVGGVNFEAVTAGEAGNGIKVVIEQGAEATDSANVDAMVKFEADVLTITLGSKWDIATSASVAEELTVAALKDLIEADTDAAAAIKVTNAEDTDVVKVATETALVDGKDEVEAGVDKAATLTFTFSEAVTFEAEELVITAGSTSATIAKADVAVAGKTVTVTLANEDIKTDSTITAIKGLTTANGVVLVPEAGVKVTAK